MSEIKRESNRKNATKSTGPKSTNGKKTASQNARRHGILSTHLVLEDESRDEFDLLLTTLQEEMEPVGLVEQTLVERVAVTIWRQRRLVRAETADVELKQRLISVDNLLMAANSLGVTIADKRLKEALSNPHLTSEGTSKTMGRLLAQLGDLSRRAEDISLAKVEEDFPLAYRELLWLADGTMAGFTQMLKTDGAGLMAYVAELIPTFREEFDRERIKELVNLHRETAPVRTAVDTIGRYQSALDNELYKALRALREAQNWRASRIDAQSRRVPELESVK